MDIALHPKLQFQTHGEEREEWRKMAASRPAKVAMSYTLAELVALGCTSEQLRGANQFALVLLNLGEPIEPTIQERYPAIHLKEGNPPKTDDSENTTET